MNRKTLKEKRRLLKKYEDALERLGKASNHYDKVMKELRDFAYYHLGREADECYGLDAINFMNEFKRCRR